MDGFQVSKALQADPQTANIPIIFLTARDTLNDKVLAFDAAGIDYLTKPFNMVELKARIKAILRQRDIDWAWVKVDVEIYQSDLADNMSHELLTPMAKIFSALDIMNFKHLQHILHHLLDNACKFSPHKGRVRSVCKGRANIIITGSRARH